METCIVIVACHTMVDGFCCIRGLGLTRVSDVRLQLANQPLNCTGRLAGISCEIYRSTQNAGVLYPVMPYVQYMNKSV